MRGEPRRGGFTLVELLTVVAVLVVLLSILMPTLRQAKVLARLAVCKAHMRSLTVALQNYCTDWNRKLPWTQSRANPSTCQVIGFSNRVTGFGCLYEGGYIGDHRVFYCPDSKPYAGWSTDPPSIKASFLEHFPEWFRAREGMRIDYALGWWSQKAGEYPSTIRQGGTLESYMRSRTLWMADEWGIFPYYYQTVFHNNCEYQNVATTDGGVTHIRDFRDLLPTSAYYYPYNDRPMWGWWSYFGSRIK